MQNHQQSADRIAKVTKEIWRRLVLKGKLPPPRKIHERRKRLAEVISLNAAQPPIKPKK